LDKHAIGHLKRGFFWIGSANLIARLMDLGSIIILLLFLSKEEMGTAALAWTISTLLESFSGLGIGAAILQTKKLKTIQLYSSWWYIMGIASVLFCAVSFSSPAIASFYSAPLLIPMIIVSASKLIFVGGALIPLQLLNRELRFKEIGATQTIATLFASIIKIVLAISGAGAWSLVIGNTAHGFFTFTIVSFLKQFKPKIHFAFSEIKKLASFGIKVSISSIIYNFYRNADYLIIGRLLGKEILGLYKVAFDVAMTPALTVLKTINRTALPVFSRYNKNPEKLKSMFLWIQKNLLFITIPIALFLTFTAADILQIVGKGQWIAATPAIQILVWAAALRSIAQVFPQLFHACGKPEFAIYDSLIALILLAGTFTGFIVLFKDTLGFLSICYAWLFSYPLLISILIIFTKKIIPLKFSDFIKALKHPIGSGILNLLVLLPFFIFRDKITKSTWMYLILVLVIIGNTTLFYFRFILKKKSLNFIKETPEK